MDPNKEIVLLPSGARNTGPFTSEFDNLAGAGLIVVVDLTAFTTAASLTVAINGKDPTSGKTWNLLTSAAIVANSTVVLRVSPQLTAAANLIAKDLVPKTVQVVVTHGNANSHTYSLVAILTKD